MFYGYCINVQARGAKAVFQFYPENPDQVRYSFIVLYRLTWNSVCVFADGTNHATGNEGGVYRRRGHRLPQQHESKKVGHLFLAMLNVWWYLLVVFVAGCSCVSLLEELLPAYQR
jgi:hypothetical protein